MTESMKHICPHCGKEMIIKTVVKNFCSSSAEFIDTPCPGDEPETLTPIAGSDTELFDVWYCPQCTE